MKDKRWGIYWAEQVYKKWQAEKEEIGRAHV